MRRACRRPRSRLAYLVAFNTLTGATNPFRPDVALFLNQSVAWVLATFLTLLTFRLILPRNPTDATRLRRTIRDDTLAVVAGSASWRRAGSSASSTASRSSARCSPASRPR